MQWQLFKGKHLNYKIIIKNFYFTTVCLTFVRATATECAELDSDRVDGPADNRPDGGKKNTMKNIFNKVLSSSGTLPIAMPL